MKKTAAVLISMAVAITAFPALASDNFAKGDVLVVLKNSSYSASSSPEVRMNAAMTTASSVGAKVAKMYTNLSSSNTLAVFHSDNKSAEDLLTEVEILPNIVGASLNYKVKAMGSVVPNDRYYNQLWGLKAIKAPEAWETTIGSEKVYIAVVDTGVNYTHDELRGNFDTTNSYNFITSNTTNYMDYNGHGSHVAGIAAAAGNNNLGIAGVNWKAKVLSIRVLDQNGEGYFSDIIDGLNHIARLLDYSVNLAAVNMSIGGYAYGAPNTKINSDPLWIALKAVSDRNKAVICVAAGNESNEVGEPTTYSYPAAGFYQGQYCYPASFTGIDNMLVVAAANDDTSYSRAYFSNYSPKNVDIAAPGVGILSTVLDQNYSVYNGTSMATPYVAGTAALLKAAKSSASASNIKYAIITGANANFGKTYTKNGFLNVQGALEMVMVSNPGENLGEAPKIKDLTFTSAALSMAYSLKPQASGTNISWSISSGSLPKGLALNAVTGEIYGTPTTEGYFTFTLRASNAYGSDTKSGSITVGLAPSITYGNTLPAGTANQAYSTIYMAARGTRPITWSVTGNFPIGLNFNVDEARIYGTPSKSGEYTFSIKVENDFGYDVKTYTVTIKEAPTPVISDITLPEGTVGTAYPNTQLSLADASLTATWTLSNSTKLPTGMVMSNAGVISGKPTTAGTYSFEVKATTTSGKSATKKFSIIVKAQGSNISITPSALSNGTLGTRYYVTLAQNGGTGSVRWTVVSPSTLGSGYTDLPTGITLNATSGVLSGTPTINGTYKFRVNVSCTNGNAYMDYTVTITGGTATAKPVISTSSLADATVNRKYTANIETSGGNATTWKISSGSLPTGLTLNATTGQITGTPTKNGTFGFSIMAGNNLGWSAARTLTITVKDVAPNYLGFSGSSTGYLKTNYTASFSVVSGTNITWTISGLPSGVTVTSTTNAKATISGVPTKIGTFTVKAVAKNSAGSQTTTQRIIISSSASSRGGSETGITYGPDDDLLSIPEDTNSPESTPDDSEDDICDNATDSIINTDTEVVVSGDYRTDEDIVIVLAGNFPEFVVEDWVDEKGNSIEVTNEVLVVNETKYNLADETSVISAEAIFAEVDDLLVYFTAKNNGKTYRTKDLYVSVVADYADDTNSNASNKDNHSASNRSNGGCNNGFSSLIILAIPAILKKIRK